MANIDVIRPLFDWTSVRWNKCLALYDLAKQATGPIVELGAFDGNGTIALALGAKAGNGMPVYGVDQWRTFTGLYRQRFAPTDKDNLIKNARAAGVTISLVHADSETAAAEWKHGPIALLVWDISLPRMIDDFLAWQDHIAPGGLFVGKDTRAFDFGWPEVWRTATDWELIMENPEACLWAIQKPYSG